MRQLFRRTARHVRGVAALLAGTGMVLAVTAPAQAAAVGHTHSNSAGTVHAKSAPDVRAVCQPAEKGYSTCMALQRTNVRQVKGVAPDTAPSGYGPSQLQSAYNLPSATAGRGQTVAIVDSYDDPHAEADLQAYRAQYGLPVCDTANGCFQKLNQNGKASPLPPAAGSVPNSLGWDAEESLDMDMVSAICPNCHIILIEANSSIDRALYTAEDTAAGLASFVSDSWASCEFLTENTTNPYFDHPGVAITAASGDYGYDNYLAGCRSPSYPASSRYVTSVGGTSLTQDSSSPRGWGETTWSPDPQATGSGCSEYESKPAWQTRTGCTNRMTSDVSAVADPQTGVAVYDTYSQGGWSVYGGTSVATPIIASAYALAGTPAAGTYPASYPYQHTSALNDITSGSDYRGTCKPARFCTAGPGYDGPTGLGTPSGVAAFQDAPSGLLSGQVTGTDGKPLAGATVSAGSGGTVTTNSSGDYTMTVADGTYSVSARAFGYQTKTVAGVTVSTGQTTTENVALKAVPSHTLSGTITDGSGHKWPLYATINVSGYPGGAVYTNPYTGHYGITLPDNGTYELTVHPVYQGYSTVTASVRMGIADETRNFKVSADSEACAAATGYATAYNGSTQAFTGWTGTTAQDGWTNVDNQGNGDVWMFGTDPTGNGEPPNSDGQYAVINSQAYYGYPDNQDTSLVSPVENLSKDKTPVINFDTNYFGHYDETADVDLSLDGGQTWTTVWSQAVGNVDAPVSIQIPQAAGQPDVQVRFHYTEDKDFGYWWGVDNVFIGDQGCKPLPGGLVDGVVTDSNTGKPVNGATVTDHANPGQNGVSAANPADPNLANGFYWMFAKPGSSQFTATDGNYTPSTQTVGVAGHAVTHQDWSLQAGNLSLSPGSLSATQTLGAAKVEQVKLTDTGSEPVQVRLYNRSSGFSPMGVKPALKGAPLERIKGHYSTGAMALQKAKFHGDGSLSGIRPQSPSAAPWTSIADYPEPVMDNAVGYDAGTGKVYSAGGYNGSVNVSHAYVLSGSPQAWSAIAPPPQALEAPAGAFLDGAFYTVGGWDGTVHARADVYAYDPLGNSWSHVASLPTAVAGAATAVLNGLLYVIGGCTTATCRPGSDAVYSYSPSSNRWTQLAHYPTPVAFLGCAGIDSEVVCAGGQDPDTSTSLSSTYVYNPAANSWSLGAKMPFDDWGMAASGSGNELQLAAGVTNNSSTVTNQAAEYHPSSNTWTTLPNAGDAEYRGGGSCGIYQIGGSIGGFTPTPYAEVLPGYNQCGTEKIPWLSASSSKFTLTPGQSRTVAVTMDSSTLSQPGSYTAQLGVETNTPYQFRPISITMQANPPSTWSKVTGTVADASTGKPIAGATVHICTQYDKATGTCGAASYTLTTDSNGNYQLWLNRDDNPLRIMAAAPNYRPATKVTRLIAGAPDAVNFALNKTG